MNLIQRLLGFYVLLFTSNYSVSLIEAGLQDGCPFHVTFLNVFYNIRFAIIQNEYTTKIWNLVIGHSIEKAYRQIFDLQYGHHLHRHSQVLTGPAGTSQVKRR